MTQPAYTDQCWPADVSSCTDWDTYDQATQQRALAAATSTLRALTAYQIGGCPITVRPCRKSCWEPWLYEAPSGYGWSSSFGYRGPAVVGGQWINIACGCASNCGCTTVCEVDLPMPVGDVVEVQVDGTVIPAAWYRVDNGHYLVWVGDPAQPDMLCGWPLCQDMNKPLDQSNTFAVTYLNAWPVDGMAAYAAGTLACEFAKASTGAKGCRLPTGVTQVVRQGVAYVVNPGTFPGGVTGIPDIDAWIQTVNPNHVKQPPSIWWPDRGAPRVTTWSAP